VTFLTIVIRSLVRRPVRTGLTLVGIAIGIGTLEAQDSKEQGPKLFISLGFDLVLCDLGKDINPKAFDASVAAKIASMAGIKETNAVLARMMSIEEVPIVMVSGAQWGGFTWPRLKVVKGRLPNHADEPAVVLGKLAAAELKKDVGETVLIEDTELKVVGIAEAKSVQDDGSLFVSLAVLQELFGEKAQINLVQLRLTDGISAPQKDALIGKLKEMLPNGTVITAEEITTRVNRRYDSR
jgi:putative ABC transport system permease protein